MLQQEGEEVLVLERGEVGAAWTTRYDRLHLHTVRWLSSLPGYRIPRAFGKWPARERVIEYLSTYARRNRLDVRTGVGVERLDRADDRWAVATSGGGVEAERVVVATGQSNVPFIPAWPGAFAGELVHSADYRNPAPYAGKRVLASARGTPARRSPSTWQKAAARRSGLLCGRRRASCAATRSASRASCSESPRVTCRSGRSTGSLRRCGGCRSRTFAPTGCRRRCGRTRSSSTGACSRSSTSGSSTPCGAPASTSSARWNGSTTERRCSRTERGSIPRP